MKLAIIRYKMAQIRVLKSGMVWMTILARILDQRRPARTILRFKFQPSTSRNTENVSFDQTKHKIAVCHTVKRFV